MKRPARLRFDFGSLIGIPAAAAVFVAAQLLEGGSVMSLWQPTAALVVFGGTFAAVLVSYPYEVARSTVLAVGQAFTQPVYPLEFALDRIVDFAHKSRRHGMIALEAEVDRTPDPFLRAALSLAVDGTNPKTVRQILDIESEALAEAAERPAEVLETAAGYTPTLGILGAVLGLIHVMESLSEPTKLGAGIAVAFVATVYGVACANLLLLPLATKLRGRARQSELHRELVIEGVLALQEGLSPLLIEQKLGGYLPSGRRSTIRRRVA